MGEVVIGGCLHHSDHEIVEFQITGERRKTDSKTSTLDAGRADFRILKELVSKVPRKSAFEVTGVDECWSLFKSTGTGNSSV